VLRKEFLVLFINNTNFSLKKTRPKNLLNTSKMSVDKRKKPTPKTNNESYLNVLKKIDLDVDSKLREMEMQDEEDQAPAGVKVRPGLLRSLGRQEKVQEDDNDDFLSLGDLLNEAEKDRVSTDNIKQHLVYLSRQEVSVADYLNV
jgi:hypothetical protein